MKALISRTPALILALVTLAAGTAAAQAIDRPAATVRLHKLDVISVRQLRKHIELLEQRNGVLIAKEQRQRVLDLLVGERLIEQAAARARIFVSADDVTIRIEQLKQQEGRRVQLGRPLTDAEYRALVRQTGLSWEAYREQLRSAIIQQRYVARTRGEELSNIVLPTEDEVVEFYEANKTPLFVQPDMVQFKHIYVDTRALTGESERAQARRRADEIYRELQQGADFDDLVVKYSDDEGSRYSGGTFGTYLRRDDQVTSDLLGREFFEAPFLMQEGETSGVLQSNAGFHVIRIADRVPAKILGLDDPVNPMSEDLVRDQIRLLLANDRQVQAYQRALLAALEELKEEANIRIFTDNLNW